MADLSDEKREDLPAKDFGLPDKAHARNAKARAAQQLKAGNLSKEEKERIDRKADKKLDE